MTILVNGLKWWHSLVLSVYWVADLSDAPYSNVAPFSNDEWNIYRFSVRIYLHIFFGRCAAEMNRCIKWWGVVLFVFRHVSFARWARITRWRFVSSSRCFEDLKTKFSPFISLSVFWCYFLQCILSLDFQSFNEFLCTFSLCFLIYFSLEHWILRTLPLGIFLWVFVEWPRVRVGPFVLGIWFRLIACSVGCRRICLLLPCRR